MRRNHLLALPAAAALALACGEPRPFSARKVADPCTLCHGSAASAAPPRSIGGETSTGALGVGAHQLHLRDTPIRAALACSECHRVPAGVADPGHVEGGPARLTWGPLATAQGAAPSWDRQAATCSGVYCHGATLHAPPASPPVWTYAAEPDLSPPSAAVCGACHGWPPPPPHPPLSNCWVCHPDTVRSDGTIDVAGGKHVNGRLDGGGGGPCGACHAVPPATGAHLVHYGDVSSPPLAAYGDLGTVADYLPGGAPYYAFGCGNCHPIDPAKHMDGALQVELADAAAPAGSLKALAAPGASYAGGTCNGVYCHSSGQAAPQYRATPPWTSGTALGCAGCHDNPPSYPSGGAGSATANTHVVLADDGWELGHFAGLPGPWHGSAHRAATTGRRSAPMTCQTCHAATVDPASSGPSGLYWLDTGGVYRIDDPAADPTRLGNASWLNTQCATCHGSGGTAPAGAGAVLPLKHVNGQRDVVFDGRTVSGGIPGYPGAPADAASPYWMVLTGGSTWSANLSTAAYAPATKTCSSVACHLSQTSVRWGLTPVGLVSCDYCHQQSGVPPPP